MCTCIAKLNICTESIHANSIIMITYDERRKEMGLRKGKKVNSALSIMFLFKGKEKIQSKYDKISLALGNEDLDVSCILCIHL